MRAPLEGSAVAAMAAAATHVDELVKEYLLQRGLTASFRAFELELKNEKEKGLRVGIVCNDKTSKDFLFLNVLILKSLLNDQV